MQGQKSFFVHKDAELRILHQNIASVLAKRELLELAILDLENMRKEPNVICLSETFLKSGSEQNLNVHNYDLATFYSREKKRNGVCILLKKGLEFKELNLRSQALPDVFECCGLKLISYKLLIVCIYRTPNSDIDKFFEKFNNLL